MSPSDGTTVPVTTVTGPRGKHNTSPGINAIQGQTSNRTHRPKCFQDQWAETRGPGAAFKGVLGEIGLLSGLADSLRKRGGTNIVIFGHNHNATLDKDSFFMEDRIYANCGTWCEEKKPCTYVETEKDDKNRKHHVRVMKWKDNQPVRMDEATAPL